MTAPNLAPAAAGVVEEAVERGHLPAPASVTKLPLASGLVFLWVVAGTNLLLLINRAGRCYGVHSASRSESDLTTPEVAIDFITKTLTEGTQP